MSYNSTTPTFWLPQWILSDPPQMSDFNNAFSEIDDFAGGVTPPSNPNLLINSWFKYAVNQRGNTSFSSANSYTVDRWMLESGTAAYTQGTGMTLTNARITQYLEGLNGLIGEEFTLSAKLGGQIISVSGTLYSQGQITGNGLTISNTETGYITASVYGSGLLEWVKLEIGSKATQYSPLPIAAEYSRCMRYYQKLQVRQGAYVYASNAALYRITFTPMRVTPTPSGVVNICNNNGGSVVDTTTPTGYGGIDWYEMRYVVSFDTYLSIDNLALDAEIYE